MTEMAEAKAHKRDVLDFMEVVETVTPHDLMEKFGYTHSYTCKKLSVLKKQRLVTICRRGHWALTENGSRRLCYLSKKLGVLTERQKRDWHTWWKEENQKPSDERTIWSLEEDGVGQRLVKLGERGGTLEQVREVAKLNKEALLLAALSELHGESVPKSKILLDFLGLIANMRVQGRSWREISNEVEQRFGARLGEEVLKNCLDLFKAAVRKSRRHNQPANRTTSSPPSPPVRWPSPRR